MRATPLRHSIGLILCLTPVLACGEDGDDDCDPQTNRACNSDETSADDGPVSAAAAPTDDGSADGSQGETNGTSPDDEGRVDESTEGPQGDSGDADAGTTGTGSGDEDTAQGETGRPDACAGLDEDTCYAESQLGNCQPIWGVPWIDVQGQWCLFPNGTTYLGCAVSDGCAKGETTVCDADTQGTWNLSYSCVPGDAHLAACEPPGDCVY